MKPTAQRIRELFKYDPETGIFVRRVPSWGKPAGSIPGGLSKFGYRQISVDGRTYTAQRLAWLYVYDQWPDGDIDHINHVRDDNRIENLRILSRRDNLSNRTKWGKTPTKGVYPNGKWWKAGIVLKGKFYHLGNFATIEEAAIARRFAETVFR